LQKLLADAGVASRRASEKLILAGEVRVNGQAVTELGTKVDPGQDRVTVNGQPVKAKRKLYLAVNKPKGCLCARSDEHGRPLVSDLLPKEWNNLYSVGRLDYNSEGLIFYTNDGDFSLRLTHPRYGVTKKYMVTVVGKVEPETLQKFTEGVYHDGEKLKAERAKIVKASNSHTLVEILLKEGKNREIRRLFESQGIEVERQQRVQIGSIKLGELPKGKWRTLTEAEIKSLLSPRTNLAG
jgi:23S rRNA pseudouridine2605 synthase